MKTYLKGIFGLTLTAVLLAGCGADSGTDDASTSKQDSQAGSQEAVEISFMIPDWGAPTEAMLADFEAESGIKVNVQPTAWDDIRDKIATAAAGQTVAADVFEVDWSWVGEFQSAGWLEPIAVSDETKADMPTLSTFMIEDEVYAVPYANDFRVAFFNAEDAKAAGVEATPQTWDDVIATASAIKEKGIKEYPLSLPMNADENTTTTFLWLTYTRNGIVFNDDNTLNEAATADTLAFIDELNQSGLINPANRTLGGFETYLQLTADEASFLVGPSSFVSRINDKEESKVVDKVQPILLPGKDGQATATVPFNEAIGISPYSEQPEAAAEFVEWYTSEETQLELFEELNASPTRLSILNQLVEEDKIKDSGAMLELFEMVETPFPNGVPMYYTEMSTEIFNTINQLVNEQITVEEAVKQMTTNVNAIVEENA